MTRDVKGQELLAHAAWLRRLARELIHDPGAAEDAVQDTFVAALRRPPGAERPVRPWLAAVLRNFARMRARAAAYDAARACRAAVAAPSESLPSAEALLAQHEQLRQLAALVSALEEPYRSTILLWSEQGLSPTEIARRQGVPAGTVRWRLKAGLDRLRRRLDEAFGDRRIWSVALVPLVSRGPLAPLVWLLKVKTAVLVAAAVALLAGTALWQRGKHGGEPPGGAGPGAAAPAPEDWRRAELVAPGAELASVAGRVLDPTGAAVAGALVTASPRLLAWDPAAAVREVITLATAVSDERGQYQLSGLPPGPVSVSAASDRFAAAHRGPLELRAGQAEAGFDLQLRAGGVVLSGTISDAGGGAIAEARVAVVGHTPAGLTFQAASIALVVARGDQRGQFRVRVVPGIYDLQVTAAGYAPASIVGLPLSADFTRDVRLHPAARLAGRVIRRDSREGVADAQVTLLGARTGAAVRPQQRVATATTDAEGAFAFSMLEPGAYDVLAERAPLAGRTPAPVSVVVAGANDAVVVQVAPRAVLRGQVRSSAGAPLPGARIAIGRLAIPRYSLREVTADREGRYRFEAVLPGDHWLWARAVGHGWQRRLIALGDTDVTADFTLPPGVVVEGRVTDAAGAPAAGVGVTAAVQSPDDRRGLVGFAQGQSRGDGQFRFADLPPGSLTVEAHDPLRGAGRQGPLLVQPGERRPITITLPAPAFLTGSVRWDDGRAGAGVVVRGFTDDAPEARGASTDGAGRFRLGPFAPGARVRLVATRGDAMRAVVDGPAQREVVAQDPGDTDAGVLVLARGDQVIRGVVLDPARRPVAGAFLRAVPQTSPGEPTDELSGLDGRFLLSGLRPGLYVLSARQPGFPSEVLRDVPADGAPRELRLRRGARLRGQVVRAGQPVTAFTLALFPADRAPVAAGQRDRVVSEEHPFEAPDGRFEMDGLEPGAYDLVVTSVVGGLSGSFAGLTTGDDARDVRIDVDEGATVRGRLVDQASTAALSGLRLLLDAPGKSPQSESDASGAFVMSGVPRGIRLRVDVGRTVPAYAGRFFYLQVPAEAPRFDAGTIPLARVQ